MSKKKTKFEVFISKSVSVQLWGDIPTWWTKDITLTTAHQKYTYGFNKNILFFRLLHFLNYLVHQSVQFCFAIQSRQPIQKDYSSQIKSYSLCNFYQISTFGLQKLARYLSLWGLRFCSCRHLLNTEAITLVKQKSVGMTVAGEVLHVDRDT